MVRGHEIDQDNDIYAMIINCFEEVSCDMENALEESGLAAKFKRHNHKAKHNALVKAGWWSL